GILPESRAVLCIPITYGESLLGVLNVESREENAFPEQDVLIMSTLADLLATAPHNAFIFQKLQQQSITAGLTGIKTRRFFWLAQDAMLAEHAITGSFGVASFPAHGFSAEDIIRVADAGMYSAKHAGGNRVSMAEEFGDAEHLAGQRQQISTYIEGFLQREQNGPDDLEDLVSTLRRLCGGEEDCNVQVLKESIEVLA